MRPGPEVAALPRGDEPVGGPTSSVSGTLGIAAGGGGCSPAGQRGRGWTGTRGAPEPLTPEGSLGSGAAWAAGGRTFLGKGGGAPVCGGSLGRVALARREWGRSATAPGGGSCPGLRVRPEWGARRCHSSVQQGALLRELGGGGVGEEGGPRLAAHTSPIIKHYVQKAPGDFPEPRSPRRPPARPTEPMDLSAAAALCLWLLSACRPRDGLEAAAVLRAAGAGPVGRPGGEGGSGGRTLAPAAGGSAAPAAAAPGVRAARRASGSGFRNGSVVPHQFMMSLYRNLAGRAPAGAAAASTSGSGRHGRADTITGFADQANQGTHASSAPVHPVRS